MPGKQTNKQYLEENVDCGFCFVAVIFGGTKFY
jgi:hypothetical protein